jgi:endonuclease YncB( thermonuclease family)
MNAKAGHLAGLLLLLPLWPFKADATTILSIGDGDTIRVLQAGKALTVRLACIDAPKTAQGPYGQKARAYLQQRLPIGCPVSTT